MISLKARWAKIISINIFLTMFTNNYYVEVIPFGCIEYPFCAIFLASLAHTRWKHGGFSLMLSSEAHYVNKCLFSPKEHGNLYFWSLYFSSAIILIITQACPLLVGKIVFRICFVQYCLILYFAAKRFLLLLVLHVANL